MTTKVIRGSQYTQVCRKNEENCKTIQENTKQLPLAEITHKIINEAPANTKQLKRIKKLINTDTQKDCKDKNKRVPIPDKDAKIDRPLKQIGTNESAKTNCTNTSRDEIKRAIYEKDKEPSNACKKANGPVSYIRLLNEEDNSYTAWPVFKEADCGFNWKMSLRIFSSSADDDHQTPKDMIYYTTKEVHNDIKNTLKLAESLGYEAFNERLSTYKRFHKK